MLRVGINGGYGRMGQEIIRLVGNAPEKYQLGFAKVKSVADLSAGSYVTGFPEQRSVDVVIDFSSPLSAMEALSWCLKERLPLVIGTSGFTRDAQDKIKAASAHIPILQSANMSLSVNVLYKVSELVARKLAHYEVEICESHHRYKKDAPSGTALRLGEVIASARNQEFDKVAVFDRTGNQNPLRHPDEIGFSVIRGGDIVGRHTVNFITDGEELNFTSMINNRQSFAVGALVAATFIAKCEAGWYTMEDALGLTRDCI